MSDRLWRTLVRIESIDAGGLWVIVPGWNPNELVRLPIELLPYGVRVEPGARFHCRVNIGAERAGDLRFMGPFEDLPPLVPDGLDAG